MLKITLIVCGNKMPAWVLEGMRDYTKRLTEYAAFSLIEIPLLKRGKSTDNARIFEKEMNAILNVIPGNARLIVLDIKGETFSSEALSQKIEKLQMTNSHLCFIIGGPEGLSPELVNKADDKWSLSALTLAHPIARIVFIEAIYRAFAISQNHPYHK